MFRILVPFILATATVVGETSPTQPEKPKKPSVPEKSAWLSSASLIKSGLDLLKNSDGTINLAINPGIDWRLNFAPVFAPRGSVVNLEVNLPLWDKAQKEVEDQLKRETNDLLKQQLEVVKRQLDVQIGQTKLAVEQMKIQEQIRDHQTVAFEYWKNDKNALLRRDKYSVPAGKLVVVVADFSSGGSSEGVEIADEIANALHELREKCGIDVEILVGEIKSGVVIRNEQMARDLGQHFPKGTCYAVIWGTLSPRTVGKFRPHVTCVMKVDEDRGLSQSYTINPESQPLPRGDTDEEQRRDQHKQLIAFTCAVIPGCYASYELTQDRRPNLEQFYKFLETAEKGSDFVKTYREELKPLTTWIDHRSPPDDKLPNYDYLRRLTPLSKEGRFPTQVLNTRDNSIMTLITQTNSDKQMEFDHPSGGKYVVYIDVTETTNRQFLPFLNQNQNQTEGGAKWLEEDPTKPWIINLDPMTKKFRTGQPAIDLERPVINVNYFGARAYCRWAGKELPTVVEWQAAAVSATGGPFPWGQEVGSIKDYCANAQNREEVCPTHRVGSFAAHDRSRIGCLDMAGNVSEWCTDTRGDDRAVCGGNHYDREPASFMITRTFAQAQVSHFDWIGFRGVVRIKVKP